LPGALAVSGGEHGLGNERLSQTIVSFVMHFALSILLSAPDNRVAGSRVATYMQIVNSHCCEATAITDPFAAVDTVERIQAEAVFLDLNMQG
jgi:hypothetical protein